MPSPSPPLSPQLSPQLSLVRLSLQAGPALPSAVANLVLDQLVGPDLSVATLLVPDLRVAAVLRRAFGISAARRGHAVCLPPRMVTPEDALAEALPGRAVEPFARRAERLYGLVRRHDWFRRESLWDTCAAVIALADELGEAHVAALDEGEWRRAIRAAYSRGVAHADSREARLVWDVWQAETAGAAGGPAGEAVAPTVFGAMAMQAWCDNAAGPLFVLANAPLSKRWISGLARHAGRAPVTLIDVAAPLWARAVWGAPAAEERETTEEKAQAIAEAPHADALPEVRILAADSLEGEAGAVVAQVQAWLAAGITGIGLIALDTLVARRARALLERRQILLADEAGWRLSTTSAATAVMRWVEAVAGGLPSRIVIDFLKSPFVLDDIADDDRDLAVAAIEDAVHRHDITRIGPALLAVQGMPPAAAALVQRLLAAQAAWPRGEASFGTWTAALDASLDELGIRARLVGDPAGADVLALLAQLLKVLGGGAGSSSDTRSGLRASLGEWRVFLSAQFERASFRNRAVDSPVVLTTLEGAQLRPFEAVLLIGADAAHLGAAAPDALFVNAALRHALGLSDAAAKREALHHQLACLMAMAGQTAATWRRRNLDEAQPLSPPLARLELARRIAGLPSGVRLADAAPPPGRGQGTPHPAPQAAGRLPQRISVSAYASLLACPYRFFATAILGLAEPDELEEELSKRDYGTWVHRVLKRFHDDHPLLQEVADEILVTSLERIADQVFAPLIAFNYLSLGWKLRLQQLFPAYIAWQRAREAEGWRYAEGEAPRSLGFDVGEREVQLVGRIDRIDSHAGGDSVALIDYKTRRIDDLKRQLRHAGEEAQLAGYAMFEAARGKTVGEAGLAAIDGDKVELAQARIDAEAEHARAERLLWAVQAGAPLPANGVEHTCSHCQVRGLCRKDYWGGTT